MDKKTLIPSAKLIAELKKFEDYRVKLSVAGPDQYSIYILPSKKYAEYPKIMQEIGFQRKRAFSGKGAGGFDDLVDIDDYDRFYDQLIVVKREEELCEIVGGYRFFIHRTVETLSQLDMGRLFNMRSIADKKFLPAVCLGRSWVKMECQGGVTFSLVLLGLGVIRTIVYNESLPEEQKAKLWFGKVTNPANVQHLQLEFLDVWHPDTLNLFVPKDPLHYQKNDVIGIATMPYVKAYRMVKPYMPEIWPIYLKISGKLYTCGTAKNDIFGHGISETGLVIEIGSETDTMIKMFVQPVEELVKQNSFLMDLYRITV